jgi:hypothetical protein
MPAMSGKGDGGGTGRDDFRCGGSGDTSCGTMGEESFDAYSDGCQMDGVKARGVTGLGHRESGVDAGKEE